MNREIPRGCERGAAGLPGSPLAEDSRKKEGRNQPLVARPSFLPFFSLSLLPSFLLSFPLPPVRPSRCLNLPLSFTPFPTIPFLAITGSLSVVPLRSPSPAITYTTTRSPIPDHHTIHDHSTILDPNLSIRAGGAGWSPSASSALRKLENTGR
ncbi:hypothetical protein E2C01_023811 [Portunus trituberculatus]|uniref:Uncharacterized protein n=1 Tax=Portunus trituberculatus TaxID=210409 RepID=A0A5B7ECM7_PORTR|nr:hypothetical protein [Portunus trituberculatus]